MSTRGIMGFRHKEVDKLIYNHSDSYPTGLGNQLSLELIQVLKDEKRGLKWLKEKVNALKMVVEGDDEPTDEEKEHLRNFTDLGVSNRSDNDWYCLTRHLQGEMIRTLETGYAIDSHGFIEDSLFCEWAYIVNLDTENLEVYRGFQKAKHDKGRYAHLMVDQKHRLNSGNVYYPCALLMEIPFKSLKKAKDGRVNWVKDLEKLREEGDL